LKNDKIAAINEIRRRIVERGESNQEIMQQLGLPARTYYRYRAQAFQGKVNEYYQLISKSDLSEYIAVLDARMNKARTELWDLAHNDKLDPKDRDSRREAIKDSVSMAAKLFHMYNRILVTYGEDVSKGNQPVFAPHLVAETNNKASLSQQEVIDQSVTSHDIIDDVDPDDDDDDDDDLLDENDLSEQVDNMPVMSASDDLTNYSVQEQRTGYAVRNINGRMIKVDLADALRRSKVVEMRARGFSQTEIAYELQVSKTSISYDMQYLSMSNGVTDSGRIHSLW
jgi:hypothetical protein